MVVILSSRNISNHVNISNKWTQPGLSKIIDRSSLAHENQCPCYLQCRALAFPPSLSIWLSQSSQYCSAGPAAAVTAIKGSVILGWLGCYQGLRHLLIKTFLRMNFYKNLRIPTFWSISIFSMLFWSKEKFRRISQFMIKHPTCKVCQRLSKSFFITSTKQVGLMKRL